MMHEGGHISVVSFTYEAIPPFQRKTIVLWTKTIAENNFKIFLEGVININLIFI